MLCDPPQGEVVVQGYRHVKVYSERSLDGNVRKKGERKRTTANRLKLAEHANVHWWWKNKGHEGLWWDHRQDASVVLWRESLVTTCERSGYSRWRVKGRSDSAFQWSLSCRRLASYAALSGLVRHDAIAQPRNGRTAHRSLRRQDKRGLERTGSDVDRLLLPVFLSEKH